MQNGPINLYRAEQVRELERLAISIQGISSFELMNRAGVAVFACMNYQWPEMQSIALFCGAGNNAGDGYIVAKLALLAGLKVVVYSLVDPGNLSDDALLAYRQYQEVQGEIILFHPDQVITADVLVDALFGIGLSRPITGLYAQAISLINATNVKVIAIDIPSGIHADTGCVMACAVKAHCTVSFVALKQGLLTGSAVDYCGDIIYESLAVPDAAFLEIKPATVRVTKALMPPRDRYSHKGRYGHVLIIGGDHGYTGAARLAGEAALRMGAGLVSIATRVEHAALMNLSRPELMCHGVETPEQLARLLDKASIVVIGPGLGQSDWAKSLFNKTISAGKPMIIDADALNLLAKAPSTNSNWILTPHPGEAARLLNCTTAEIEQDRFASVAAIQAQYDGIALLKGAGTLIASADDCAISTTGNPGMATGGMGDVLVGVIAGMVAQGLSMKEAAQQGTYHHGLAADNAVREKGERGLLASDLMPYLRVWSL
ncbi:MAG: NAD(P)H-hydrate dehydratase [Methylococcales bacterium]|nr:MAG: NAD(P)H-hydrate dehydratase [Methylococcales bacterium]